MWGPFAASGVRLRTSFGDAFKQTHLHNSILQCILCIRGIFSPCRGVWRCSCANLHILAYIHAHTGKYTLDVRGAFGARGVTLVLTFGVVVVRGGSVMLLIAAVYVDVLPQSVCV